MKNYFLFLFLIQLILCGISEVTLAATSEKNNNSNSKIADEFIWNNTSLEYKLTPQIHKDVLPIRPTELWAKLYWPSESHLNSKQRPLIIILHGNHPTCGTQSYPRLDINCQYTTQHTCPTGYEVIPNHLGYEYLADELTKNGFLVLSINANYGINCGEGTELDSGLNLARGRLILKHIELLKKWSQENQGPEGWKEHLPLTIDFTNVGLIGHSRGGEGVRAAYALSRDVQEGWFSKIGVIGFKGIFEIAPVDGQTTRMLNPENVAWHVLLPACDGDVSNLEGIKVFDRMANLLTEKNPKPKSAMVLWGANHNFFNTEWKQSDSNTCVNHTPLFPLYPESALQQKLAILTAIPFFKKYLKNVNPLNENPLSHLNNRDTSDKTLSTNTTDKNKMSVSEVRNLDENKNDSELSLDFFDPANALPQELQEITTVERSFVSFGIIDSYSYPLEDFFSEFPFRKPPLLSNVKHHSRQIPEHEIVVIGSLLTWEKASPETFAQFNWSQDDSPMPYPKNGFFEMRISLLAQELPVVFEMSLQMVGPANQLSQPVPLSRYLKLIGPAGHHSLLQTLKIPVGDFKGLTEMTGLRLIFDGSSYGQLQVNGFYLRDSDSSSPLLTQEGSRSSSFRSPMMPLNSLHIIKLTENPLKTYTADFLRTEKHDESDKLRLSFKSMVPFTSRSSLLVLAVGSKIFKISSYNSSGDNRMVFFTIPKADLKNFRNGDNIKIFYLSNPQKEVWNIGSWKDQYLPLNE